MKNRKSKVIRIFASLMEGMSFLPIEFCRPQKWSSTLFPPHDIYPLIVEQWKISIGLESVLKEITEKQFRSRTYSIGFFEFFSSTMSDDGEFRCESFNVILFSFEIAHRYEKREQEILYTEEI